MTDRTCKTCGRTLPLTRFYSTGMRSATGELYRYRECGNCMALRRAIRGSRPVDAMAPRTCKTCGQTKKTKDFYRESYGSVSCHCKTCKRAQTRKYTLARKARRLASVMKGAQ